VITTLQSSPDATAAAASIDSVYDMFLNGGVLMWPLLLCSILALAYIVERCIRLRDSELGSEHYGQEILDALSARGAGGALAKVSGEPRPLGRVLQPALETHERNRVEREKAVEDAGAREVTRLAARLKPLVVIGILAPLLGFLGTVFGMIECFAEISRSTGAIRPSDLASGISQALITTAAGLCIAIPTQAAYFWFKARIERFVRRAEDLYVELSRTLDRAPLQLPPGGPA
jgi:biopolymer transport protein ExbB